MTVGQPVRFERPNRRRIMSGVISEVCERYLVVVAGGRFYTVSMEAVRK